VAIELAGPGVTPETVDTAALLSVANAYVDLAIAVAAATGKTLSFTGVRVVNKCAALASPPSDKAVAIDAIKASNAIVYGKQAAPHGAEMRAKALRKAVEDLPNGYAARVILGRLSWPLRLTAPDERPERPWSLSSVRVRVIELQATPPRVRLACAWLDDFSLTASRDIIRQLGAHMYEEIDIDVRWTFGDDDKVEKGDVLAVHPISNEESLSAWQRWYDAAAPE
jgi:hypothetical protein